MGDSYSTLEGAQVSLGRLTAEERRFLGQMIGHFKKGDSYLDFENFYMDPDSIGFRYAARLGESVAETPLYRVCDDLARRVGIRQGYLVKEQVVRYSEPGAAERRELTTGEVAKLASCTHEAVRKAIRTGRLRARRVGRLSLIWDQDAAAYAEARSRKRSGRNLDKKGFGHLTRQLRKFLPSSYPGQSLSRTEKPLILWHEVPCGIVLERHGRQKIVDKAALLVHQSVLDKRVRQAHPPYIQAQLRQGLAFRARLAADPALTQVAVAREAGIHPVRVTRLLRLAELAPEIQLHILALPPSNRRCPVTERRLRPIVRVANRQEQSDAFRRLLAPGPGRGGPAGA